MHKSLLLSSLSLVALLSLSSTASAATASVHWDTFQNDSNVSPDLPADMEVFIEQTVSFLGYEKADVFDAAADNASHLSTEVQLAFSG